MNKTEKSERQRKTEFDKKLKRGNRCRRGGGGGAAEAVATEAEEEEVLEI